MSILSIIIFAYGWHAIRSSILAPLLLSSSSSYPNLQLQLQSPTFSKNNLSFQQSRWRARTHDNPALSASVATGAIFTSNIEVRQNKEPIHTSDSEAEKANSNNTGHQSKRAKLDNTSGKRTKKPKVDNAIEADKTSASMSNWYFKYRCRLCFAHCRE